MRAASPPCRNCCGFVVPGCPPTTVEGEVVGVGWLPDTTDEAVSFALPAPWMAVSAAFPPASTFSPLAAPLARSSAMRAASPTAATSADAPTPFARSSTIIAASLAPAADAPPASPPVIDMTPPASPIRPPIFARSLDPESAPTAEIVAPTMAIVLALVATAAISGAATMLGPLSSIYSRRGGSPPRSPWFP